MLHRKWLIEIPYFLLGLSILFFLSTHAANYSEYDAPSYIQFDPIRPPLYPIFVWLFHFAGRHQFTIIVYIHAFLTMGALLYARYWLKKHLKIADFLVFLICLITTITILFHFQLLAIGAEGLTFPFFIITFFLFVECFQEVNLKKMSYLAFWVSLIILTRLQFYYFYFVFVLLCFWHFYKGIPLKRVGVATGVFLVSILITSLIDRSYHYYKHHFFSDAPATGKLLIIQPLFLMGDKSVSRYFTDETQKFYAEKMLTNIQQHGLNQEANLLIALKPSYYQHAYESYNKNYIAMFDIVSQVFATVEPKEANKIASQIAKILIQADFKKNVVFFLWKLIEFLGGIPMCLFFFIMVCGLIVKMKQNRQWQPTPSQLFVAITILFTVLNAALVASVEAYLVAYFCYSQFILYCLAALLADRVFFSDHLQITHEAI